MARKTLSDLYRRGNEVTVTDPETGESATVWIRKMNPFETKEARDKGNAARARILMRRKDPESTIYLSLYTDAYDFDEESRIDKIIGLKAMQKRAQIETELAIADGSEWVKEDYLEGLREAWEGGLKDIWVDPEKDEVEKEEAQKVFDELSRFADEVDKVFKVEMEAMRRPYENMDEEELINKCVMALFDELAYAAWLESFYAARTFYSVRDIKDKKTRVFESIQEVSELEEEVYHALLSGYRDLEIPDLEVKDSEQTPSS